MGQRDVNRLEKCADRNFMKFSKAKCKVLNLGRKKPMQQEQLWPSCLGSSTTTPWCGGRHRARLSVGQQCAPATQNISSLLGALEQHCQQV